jgi:hypothetical protein
LRRSGYEYDPLLPAVQKVAVKTTNSRPGCFSADFFDLRAGRGTKGQGGGADDRYAVPAALRKAVLPEAASGKVALLALGFTYDSRFAVEAWTGRFRRDFGSSRDVTFFEIPMIGGMARMGRWFIDSGMRKGTPKELHENVITVYGGTDPWKNRLGFKKGDDAYLILIDSKGIVRWTHSGQFDEARFAELAELVRKLATQTPP